MISMMAWFYTLETTYEYVKWGFYFSSLLSITITSNDLEIQ